ncbi:unnamed protein product [Musa acuminata subsp. burmannicoides]
MAVEDIPQVHITSDFSCDHEVEKPQEKEPPMKCSTSDDSDPAPTMDGFFDCSICLDSSVDPVITLCGHLYCWPCIYKWMQVESISHHQCPVCKAHLSEDTLIPLHGHGSHRIKRDSDVPCRPTFHLNRHHVLDHGASNTDEEDNSLYQPMQQPQFHHNYYHQDRSSPPIAPLFHSMTRDVLGGLAASILPWVDRNHGLNLYYAEPYQFALSGNSARLRRQQMQVENSLHEIWLFLCCCALLCLLLF